MRVASAAHKMSAECFLVIEYLSQLLKNNPIENNDDITTFISNQVIIPYLHHSLK